MPKRPYEIAASEAMFTVTRPDYVPVTSSIREVERYLRDKFFSNVHNQLVDSRTAFLSYLGKDRRIGQAFMNALPEEDYSLLTGTLIDPFYKDDERSVFIAVDYLLYIKD